MVLPLAIKSYGQPDPHEALRLAGFCLTIFIRPGESNMPTPFRKCDMRIFRRNLIYAWRPVGFDLWFTFPYNRSIN